MIQAIVSTAITLALVYALQRIPPSDLHDAVEVFAVLWGLAAIHALLSGSDK